MLFGQIIFGGIKYIHKIRIAILRRRARTQSKMINLPLRHGIAIVDSASADTQHVSYYHVQSSGFFANCSTALSDLEMLVRAGYNVSKINFALSMLLYKKKPFIDNYNQLFLGKYLNNFGDYASDTSFDPGEAENHYRDLPLIARQALASNYFTPNFEILNLANKLMLELGIDPDRTIAVYYRGTDKAKEIVLADVHQYSNLVHEIDRKHASHSTVFLQTDDSSVCDVFKKEFGNRLRIIKELPTSRSNIGLHKSFIFEAGRFDGDRQAFYLLASTLIMAKCRDVIMTTSNLGLWTAFYRGHADRLYQFDKLGDLVEPYTN